MGHIKRVRLSIVNAAEDIPRLLRAYGRCCDGECALVLRPTEGRGVLVHIGRAGAHRWEAGASDAPHTPQAPCTAAEAVALARAAQKDVPPAGPITLRGQWSGALICEDGAQRVELTRKLATYGVLRITSHPEAGWRWAVERTGKWFSQPGQDEGEADTLARAIERGLANAMGLLGEACSFRDSRRRAAFDDAWAQTHPVRAAREGGDPVDRLKVKAPRPKAERAAKAKPPSAKAPKASPPKAKAPKAKAAEPAAPRAAASRKGGGRSPAPAPGAGVSPTGAGRAGTSRRASEAAPTLTEAEKDRVLMQAFAEAVKSAVGEL